MLKATLYRYTRHQNAHGCLIILLQCICVVVLLSTACYVVNIRSRYNPPWRDFHALVQHSALLWNRSSLPRQLVTAPMMQLPAIQARDEAFSKNLSTSFIRTSGGGAVFSDYGLEQTECLWSPWFDSVATTLTTAPQSFQTPPVHLHIFFLHGNAGHHTQGEYWSCSIQFVSQLVGINISTYTFKWAEQANVHRGRLVGLQADYVADVVEAVVRGAADRSVRHRVWLVAHSMGGVVARLAAQLLVSSIDLGGIATFNAPHRFPPLLLDAAMADVYRTLTVAEQPSATMYLKNPKEDAIATTVESSMLLSSARLMEVCGSQTVECVRQRRRQRRVPHLIAVTSGEMDLQIEPATVYPSPWASRYAVSFFNTLDRSLCTHATSHDGILTDPCAITLGALRLLSSSLSEAESTTEPVELAHTDLTDAHVFAQLPLPSGMVSRISLVGQLLWQQHLWPWAVSALYSYVFLAGLWPQIAQSAEVLLQLRRCWLTRCRPVRWAASSEFSVAVFLVFFYGSTCLYATLTELYLMGTAQRALYSVTHPWQWETYLQLRHTSAGAVLAPVQFAARTLFFVLISVGPVTVGINAGMALVLVCSAARCVKARVGRCRWVCGTARRRHATAAAAALFPFVLVGFYLVLLVCGADLTSRAVAWVVLFLFLPSFRRTQMRREDRSAALAVVNVESPKRDADAVEVVLSPDVVAAGISVEENAHHHLPGMLNAVLYLLQLHPFFTLRNAIVAHTLDDVSTVDWRNYVVEGGLLVLLCCAASAPLLLRVSRFRFFFCCYVGVPSSAVSLMAVAWMLVHPVESYRVLPALLWCFPSFLLSTLSA